MDPRCSKHYQHLVPHALGLWWWLRCLWRLLI